MIKEIAGDHHTAAELEREWETLQADRAATRETFPKGDSKVRNFQLGLFFMVFPWLPDIINILVYFCVGGVAVQPSASDMECTEHLQN